MLRVDGAYLYELGESLTAIKRLKAEDMTRVDLMLEWANARDKLTEFVFNSIFNSGLRTLLHPANIFLRKLSALAPDFDPGIDYGMTIYGWQIASIQRDFSKFEAVLLAALQSADLYYVMPKGAFDTQALTEGGAALFPADLKIKAPDAIADVAAAARCIAFELPTAAAFHLLRATEAVLRHYFDEKAGADNRPKSRNMGDLINTLSQKNLGDGRVLAVLKGIKDLHRNPLMHPDASLNSVDEAISLYAAVRAAIGYMLDDMTGETPPVIASLPFDEPSSGQDDKPPVLSSSKSTDAAA
jgi:hypothetical protein